MKTRPLAADRIIAWKPCGVQSSRAVAAGSSMPCPAHVLISGNLAASSAPSPRSPRSGSARRRHRARESATIVGLSCTAMRLPPARSRTAAATRRSRVPPAGSVRERSGAHPPAGSHVVRRRSKVRRSQSTAPRRAGGAAPTAPWTSSRNTAARSVIVRCVRGTERGMAFLRGVRSAIVAHKP